MELSLSLLLSFVSDVPFGRRRSRRRELFLICIVRLHWLQSSHLFSSSRAGLMPPLAPPLLPARSSNSPCSLSVPFHRASQPYLAPRLDVLSPELTLLPHFEFLFKVQFATFLAALQLSFLWLRNLRSQSTHPLGLARTQLTADRGEDCAKDRRQLRKNAALPLFSSSPAQRCSTRRHARPNHSK